MHFKSEKCSFYGNFIDTKSGFMCCACMCPKCWLNVRDYAFIKEMWAKVASFDVKVRLLARKWHEKWYGPKVALLSQKCTVCTLIYKLWPILGHFLLINCHFTKETDGKSGYVVIWVGCWSLLRYLEKIGRICHF